MDVVDLLLRWVHLLSAIALVGGAFFWRLVWVPTAKGLDETTRESVFAGLRARWSPIVMLGTALLLITGLVNAARIVSQYAFVDMGIPYHALVAIKLGLALVVFYLAARLAGRSESAQRFRQSGTPWLTIQVVLLVLLVCLAGYMKLYPRVPKDDQLQIQDTQAQVDFVERRGTRG